MAVHKVPQDVEAEDKLIAFLSMKQFIFVVIAVMLTVAAFQLGRISIFLIIPFLPFIFIFALLGLYQRRDQPAEVYLLAVMGFYLKPHRRKWDQDGIMETVKINVPKKVSEHYSDGLSKTEVKSNLSRLSTLMDTRGWAAKNAVFQTNVVVPSAQVSNDRLMAPIQEIATNPVDIHEADDMLDTTNNPTAQKFDSMVEQAAQIARENAVSRMQEDVAAGPSVASAVDEPAPGFNPYPAKIHQKTLQPISSQSHPQDKQPSSTGANNQPQLQATEVNQNASTMTPTTPDAILDLANRRDDNLSVETIAKEAERIESLDNNATISLH